MSIEGSENFALSPAPFCGSFAIGRYIAHTPKRVFGNRRNP